MSRPWLIKEEDVPLYWEAIVRITKSHPWPWTREWGRVERMTMPEQVLNLPDAPQLMHMMNMYLNPEAIAAVKDRVRMLRHRQKNRFKTLQIRPDVHLRLSHWAKENGLTLSDAIDQLLPPTT